MAENLHETSSLTSKDKGEKIKGLSATILNGSLIPSGTANNAPLQGDLDLNVSLS